MMLQSVMGMNKNKMDITFFIILIVLIVYGVINNVSKETKIDELEKKVQFQTGQIDELRSQNKGLHEQIKKAVGRLYANG